MQRNPVTESPQTTWPSVTEIAKIAQPRVAESPRIA